MSADWKTWARSQGWAIEDEGFRVHVGSRRQLISVMQHEGRVLLRSRVARRAVLSRLADPAQQAWQRNRVSDLVGFRIDRHGVLVAETSLPADVMKGEWTYLAFNLARAADRFEYVLTRKDEE
jgi:hypothetical protein